MLNLIHTLSKLFDAWLETSIKPIFFNHLQIIALTKTDIPEHMHSQFVAVPLKK